MENPLKAAPLQLSRYVIRDYSYKCNVAAKRPTPEHPVSTIVGVDYDIKSNIKDKDKFLIEMSIDLNKQAKAFKKNRYQISMKIAGEFQFSAGLEEENKARMLVANGTAILYGLARGVVAQFTGGVGIDRFVLPAVNLLAIAEGKSKRPSSAKVK